MKNADLLNKLCELYEKSGAKLEGMRRADAERLCLNIMKDLESEAALGKKSLKIDVRADLVKDVMTFCTANYLKIENQGGGNLNTIVISGWAD